MNEDDIKTLSINPTGRIAAKDLVTIGKAIKHEAESVYHKTVAQYLGCSVADMKQLTNTFNVYQFNIRQAIFTECVTACGYEIIREFGVDEYGAETPFDYKELETAPGKFMRVPEDGYITLRNKTLGTVEMIIYFHDKDWTEHTGDINIYVREQNLAVAQTFMRRLTEFANEKNIYRGKRIKADLSFIALDKEYHWDDIVLMKSVETELRKNVHLLFDKVDFYRENNLTFKRGLILQGQPGVGKSLFAKILCSTLKDVTVIWITPGDMARTDRIKTICELARELAPSLLFLEDIDLYGAHRTQANGGVLGELMNQLDGIDSNHFVVTIATTNCPTEVEGALRNRPGRFDRVIDVGSSNKDCRYRLLKLYTKSIAFEGGEEAKDAFITSIAGKPTQKMTGAHLKELVNTAIISAIDEGSLVAGTNRVLLQPKHFTDNLEVVRTKKIEPGIGFSVSKDDDPLD